MRVRTLFVVLFSCVQCFAQPVKPATKPAANEPRLKEGAPEEVRSLWNEMQADRKSQIESLEKSQAEDRALLSKTKDGRDKVPIQLRIRDRDAELKAAKEAQLPDPEEMSFTKVGSIGTLNTNPRASISLKISQVIDENNAIITIETSNQGAVHTRKTSDGREEVTSVVQPYTTSSGPMWLKANTTGWLDGYPVPREISRCKYWKMVGTQKYDTVIGGSKTVPVLQPIPLEDYLDMPQKVSADKKKVLPKK